MSASSVEHFTHKQKKNLPEKRASTLGPTPTQGLGAPKNPGMLPVSAFQPTRSIFGSIGRNIRPQPSPLKSLTPPPVNPATFDVAEGLANQAHFQNEQAKMAQLRPDGAFGFSARIGDDSAHGISTAYTNYLASSKTADDLEMDMAPEEIPDGVLDSPQTPVQSMQPAVPPMAPMQPIPAPQLPESPGMTSAVSPTPAPPGQPTSMLDVMNGANVGAMEGEGLKYDNVVTAADGFLERFAKDSKNVFKKFSEFGVRHPLKNAPPPLSDAERARLIAQGGQDTPQAPKTPQRSTGEPQTVLGQEAMAAMRAKVRARGVNPTTNALTKGASAFGVASKPGDKLATLVQKLIASKKQKKEATVKRAAALIDEARRRGLWQGLSSMSQTPAQQAQTAPSQITPQSQPASLPQMQAAAPPSASVRPKQMAAR